MRKIRLEFTKTLVRYADFLVRYAQLLYDDKGYDISMTAFGGINDDVTAKADDVVFSADGRADTVWMILRESTRRLVLHLINLTGNDVLWNTPKSAPNPVQNIRLTLRLDVKITGVYCASPDEESLQAVALPYHTQTSAYGRLLELSTAQALLFFDDLDRMGGNRIMLLNYDTTVLPRVRMMGRVRYHEPWCHFSRVIDEYILYVIRGRGHVYRGRRRAHAFESGGIPCF